MSPDGGRRWLEVRVAGLPDTALDEAAGLLTALGARAVQEEDGALTTHFADVARPDAFVRRVAATLREEADLEGVVTTWRWRDHEDWATVWRRGLDTRKVTGRIVVTPTWIPYEGGPGERVVVLDPGVAFGTAEHATTRGCLRLLDGAVRPGQRLLDVGAGSGILAVAAALLGAAEVVAVEGDPLAAEAMAENVERNGVGDRVRAETAWVDAAWIRARAPRDGIVANIQPAVLGPLVEAFRDALAPGGWLVLSGITEEAWPALERAAADAGLELERLDAEDEWRSGLFRLPAPSR